MFVITVKRYSREAKILFVITVIWVIFVRYNHEILMVNYAKPNQKLGFVRYNCEFAITVIVITEYDCI